MKQFEANDARRILATMLSEAKTTLEEINILNSYQLMREVAKEVFYEQIELYKIDL